MNFIKKNLIGILVCFFIAIPSWLIGKIFPVIGGPVIVILAGMLITCFWTNKKMQKPESNGLPKSFYRQLLSSWVLV